MNKKSIGLYMLIFSLVILITGCSNNLGTEDNELSINLSGFPAGIDNYYLKVYAEASSGGVKNIYEFDDVNPNDGFNKSLKVDEKTDFIMLYLFDDDYNDYNDDDEPEYFWRFDLKDGKKEYETSYWIDHSSFEHDEDIIYGISNQLAQTIELPLTKEINFSEKPYFLYKLSNVKGQSIEIEVSSSDGISLDYNSDCEDFNDYYNYYNYYEYDYEFISDWYYEDLYILIEPKNYDEDIKATVNIKLIN